MQMEEGITCLRADAVHVPEICKREKNRNQIKNLYKTKENVWKDNNSYVDIIIIITRWQIV